MKNIKIGTKKYFICLVILSLVFSLVLYFDGETVIAQNISEAPGNEYQISEEKLRLLKDFPFESIMGLSWSLYSERPLNEIFENIYMKTGAIYSGQKVATQDSYTYQIISNGFFISPDGYFLTTYKRINDVFTDRKVVDPNIDLKVQTHLSLKLIDLDLIVVDPEGDLAVFQANLDQVGLTEVPYVEFSSFSPAIGQPVFGIGYPDVLSVEGGLYPGFITGINATQMLESGYGLTEIISSALIPNIASGCLMVNVGGEAIGISTSGGIRSVSDRYSIFYTSNQIMLRLEYLLSGNINQGMVWTGMTLLSDADYNNLAITFDLPNGTYITDVFIDSPAYVSDLRRGDIIISVNSLPINSGNEFRSLLMDYFPGDALEIKIYRPNLDKEFVRTLYLDSN